MNKEKETGPTNPDPPTPTPHRQILSRQHHANTADSASTARRKVHFAAR